VPVPGSTRRTSGRRMVAPAPRTAILKIGETTDPPRPGATEVPDRCAIAVAQNGHRFQILGEGDGRRRSRRRAIAGLPIRKRFVGRVPGDTTRTLGAFGRNRSVRYKPSGATGLRVSSVACTVILPRSPL
jgi:hypothetical protein